MNPSSRTSPGAETKDETSATSRAYTAGLSDGLGDRLMTFDSATQSSVELLRFKREFSDAPGFEEALRARVEELTRFKHPSVATVRGVQTIDDGGLALVSNNTAGRRLSEMVHVAKGAPFAMDLIQQLGPALAALHQHGGRIAHGMLTAERIIITREGRLIVVEHVLAPAFEQLRLAAARLRADFGLAVPTGSDPVALNQRSDVTQLGFLALSLLLGRRLDPAHYPSNLTTLLDEFTHADAAASAKLRPWLERALQIGDKAFATAQEAQAAFASPGSETRTTKPEPKTETKSAESSQTSILAFRPSDSTPATGKPKHDVTKTDGRSEDTGKSQYDISKAMTPAIGLQKLDPPTPTPTSVPVASIASPRAQSGSVKWIIIAAAAVAVIGGGLYLAFSGGSKPPSSPSTASTTPPPSAPATEPSQVNTPAPPPFRPMPAQSSGQTSTPTAVPLPPSTSGNAPSTPGNSLAAGTGAIAGAGEKDTKSSKSAAQAKEPAQTEKPAPSVGGIGGVKVAAPIELQVFENGTQVGSTAGQIAVLAGTHTFDLVNESLGFRVRSTVTVKGGQMTPLTVNLPNGRLSINAAPWADVTIDGKPAGQTPLANLSVVIGQHKLVFHNPDFGDQEQMVTVKADGVARASVTFKK